MSSPCAVSGCDRPRKAKAWCLKHYRRWQRHGDPLGGVPGPGETGLWLREAVATTRPDECLLWPFGKFSTGYGAVKFGGKQYKAHQAALILSGEPRPEPPNDIALHSCDTPACVNPKHLRWGSHQDNANDRTVRNRQNPLRGNACPAARLREDQVREIRSRYDAGEALSDIARSFPVTRWAVVKAATRVTWSHLDDHAVIA